MSAESDLGDLVTNLLRLSEEFPEVVKHAAEAQMQVLEGGIKLNWSSMIPWGKSGDYVYDSIGYNVSWGNNVNDDVVGMSGVFHIDAVKAKHGKTDKNITAPQIAYWAEFGTRKMSGIPFMSNAYYATLPQQEDVFANVLAESITKRLNR